ncbi:hypothetical protein OH687_38070 [Burkholderia anthina]|nr:hypothetical protein OH687_38070 [Burkholderia anthina]
MRNIVQRYAKPTPLACTFVILHGIVMLEFEYCQVLELS